MTSPIHVSATLKAIRFKTGTQADPDPRVELVLVTDSIAIGGTLGWHMGKALDIDFTPWQPLLDDPDEQDDSDAEDEDAG